MTTIICSGCGRAVADRAACMSCPTEPEEHRGSRALDADFRAAAATGFAPLSDGEKEAFRERLRDMGAVIHGARP